MELNCKIYILRKIYESIFQRFKRCLNPNFLEKVMPVLQNSVWAENGLAFERGVRTSGVPTWRSNAWAKMKILTLDVPTWRSNARRSNVAFQRLSFQRQSRAAAELARNLSKTYPILIQTSPKFLWLNYTLKRQQ